MLTLYLKAPFAAFRTFSAGSMRPTAAYMSPSAAYGLLLNIAGFDMRYDDGRSVNTLIRDDLPPMRIALAVLRLPRVHTVFQQLHNYPVGNTAAERKPVTKGNKYNITPTRRQFLSGIEGYISVSGNDEMEERIRNGLTGKVKRKYGLPFLGDNNFLIDRLEIADRPRPARWLVPVTGEIDEAGSREVARLTIAIDRANTANTRSALFVPSDEPCVEPPGKAWITMGFCASPG